MNTNPCPDPHRLAAALLAALEAPAGLARRETPNKLDTGIRNPRRER